MVTRDHPEYAQKTRPGGGPDRSHMFVGEDHGTVCWNTPYRQAYLDLVERLVRDYDIDGLYFDTWRPAYFWPGRQVCYCEGCRKGFRQLTGKDLPWHEKDSDYTPAELALLDRYHAWQKEDLIGIVRRVRMRSSTEAKAVVGRAGRYAEVYPQSDDPSPLKVKEVWVQEQRRYVVCVNEDQAAKDRYDREAVVAAVFRSMKSLLDTRPIFHKCDETIRGHVFCSFLALVLRKELEDRLASKEWKLEWAELIRDLDNLLEMEVSITGKGYVFRSEAKGTTGKVFQACGVALPPVLRPC
jgi:hypothetical protein